MFSNLKPMCQSVSTSCEMFFIINDRVNNALDYRKVDLDPTAQGNLTAHFKKKIEDEIVIKTSGLASIPLVSSLSSKGGEVYEYDILPVADELAIVAQISQLRVSSNPTTFDFSTHKLSDVKAIVLKISDGNDSVYIYQHKYPISLHKKSGLSFMKSMSGNVLKEVEHDVIDVRKDFDFFFYNGKHYVLNLSLLESSYGLNTIIDKMVSLVVPDIVNLNIINMANIPIPNSIFDEVKPNRTYMKKLAKIQGAGLPPVTISQVQTILNDFPKFGRELSVVNNLVDLDSKRKKMFFIRLLNDEAVRTALTNSIYLAEERESAI